MSRSEISPLLDEREELGWRKVGSGSSRCQGWGGVERGHQETGLPPRGCSPVTEGLMVRAPQRWVWFCSHFCVCVR